MTEFQAQPKTRPVGPSEAARRYLTRGWPPLPLPGGSKAPQLEDWPSFSVQEAELAEHFADDCNVGVILGERSGSLVDLDLDCRNPRTPRPPAHRWA